MNATKVLLVNRLRNGWTLLEMLLVVALIGVLSSIAYPSYLGQIASARRGDAQSALSGMAIAMERWFTEHQTYVGAAQGNPPAPPQTVVYPSEAPLDGAAKFYDLRINSASVTAYELHAIPKSRQSGDKCGTLTLTSTGQRGITGAATGLTWQDCWRH